MVNPENIIPYMISHITGKDAWKKLLISYTNYKSATITEPVLSKLLAENMPNSELIIPVKFG